MANKVLKYRNWQTVLYPESMIPNWQDKIAEIMQIPFAYCIHDKDVDSKTNTRKKHVHLLFHFNGPTSYESALSLVQELQPNCTYVERNKSIRNYYDYLIHDTDDAQKKGKYLYDKSERITGNNFDIGALEQVDSTKKKQIIKEVSKIIEQNHFQDYKQIFDYTLNNMDEDAFDIVSTNVVLFRELCRGNYLSEQRKFEELRRKAQEIEFANFIKEQKQKLGADDWPSYDEIITKETNSKK